jgi:hypothetical protein
MNLRRLIAAQRAQGQGIVAAQSSAVEVALSSFGQRPVGPRGKGFQASNPDLTLAINRSGLELTMMGAKTLEAQIAGGTAKVQGDASILTQLASTMVDFDPRFEIMPGTKAREIVAKEDPYEADPRQPIPE